MELLEQLDSHIDTLLSTLEQIRSENEDLRAEITQIKDENSALEEKNRSLQEALTEEAEIRRQALAHVDGLLSKIENLERIGDENE
ncbi:MAG: cell division protein ZapB [Desulfovibrionaceae bacterium]|nr:cell division protein ZapB [Desulfovibrionaceae bacterium]